MVKAALNSTIKSFKRIHHWRRRYWLFEFEDGFCLDFGLSGFHFDLVEPHTLKLKELS